MPSLGEGGVVQGARDQFVVVRRIEIGRGVIPSRVGLMPESQVYLVPRGVGIVRTCSVLEKGEEETGFVVWGVVVRGFPLENAIFET